MPAKPTAVSRAKDKLKKLNARLKKVVSHIFHLTINDLSLGAIKLQEHRTAHTLACLPHFYADL